MLLHFYDNNYASLCCEREKTRERIELLDDDNLKEIKKLPSIAHYLETMEKVNDKETREKNGEDFKEVLDNLLENFHVSMSNFFTILKCLHSLTSELPGAPLGKQVICQKDMERSFGFIFFIKILWILKISIIHWDTKQIFLRDVIYSYEKFMPRQWLRISSRAKNTKNRFNSWDFCPGKNLSLSSRSL